MIKVLLFDLSWTILFPKDETYGGELNLLHRQLSSKPGYDFSKHFYLNEETIKYLESLKGKAGLYIFTSGKIQNAPEIRPKLDSIFNKIYSAEEIGLGKKNPESYKSVVKDLKVKPSEILFIDDMEGNVEAAKQAGLNAVVFQNLDKLKKDLQEHLYSRRQN